MYQCSKKLVTCKEYSCFDHSDFLAHLMFTSNVCWDSLGTSIFGNLVQPQVIIDPDYLPDYLSGSYDYAKSCNYQYILNQPQAGKHMDYLQKLNL